MPPALRPRRRSLLGLLAGAAASVPLLRGAAAAQPLAPAASVPDLGPALLRPARCHKASSYDRSGGNADFFVIPAGGEQVLLDADGPGVVRHLWFTLNGGPHHLKDIVLTMHWDHEDTPSVEAPLGDFFGLGLGEYFTYASLPMTVAPERALNCYLPLPFRRHARIAVRNQGGPVPNFYSNIDFELTDGLPAEAAYFHAQYRQAAPCHGWTSDWQSNGDPVVLNHRNRYGRGNYVFLDARGRGQYIGTSLAVLQNQAGWWGEGDDMIFIDQAEAARGTVLPTINGTGSEDYFNGAWDFGDRGFSY
ncbi:MAG: glycoside hydrolase family 172 protein, partial [Terriglobales bacterium]